MISEDAVMSQDIVDNPDIHLDEMFIASLVFDLIKVSELSRILQTFLSMRDKRENA